MARPLTNSIPPPPPDYKPCGIPAIDTFFFGRWPHLFTLLAREYNVPPDLLLVLLSLWEATVGAKAGPDRGLLSNSQFFARGRSRDKWVAALEASEFFMVKTAGPSDQASRYTYDEEVTAEQWESFFEMAEFLNAFPNWDVNKKTGRGVTAEKFAKWFTPEALQKVRDGELRMYRRVDETSKTPQPLTGEEQEKNTAKIKRLFAEARARKESK